MARFAAGLLAGMVITAVAGAALGIHAEDVSAEVLEAAHVAHVDPVKLAGAVNTTNLDPYVYLRAVGELPAQVSSPPTAASSSRIDCIIRLESRGDAHAVNPRSRAAGLGQFLPSTWMTTPQGRAGLSVFSPDANRAAIEYMLDAGRAREFDAVRFYGC